MKDPREVIIRPIVTEHSYDQMENNVYTFEVAKDSNKVEIRQAIEAIFNVSVRCTRWARWRLPLPMA